MDWSQRFLLSTSKQTGKSTFDPQATVAAQEIIFSQSVASCTRWRFNLLLLRYGTLGMYNNKCCAAVSNPTNNLHRQRVYSRTPIFVCPSLEMIVLLLKIQRG